MIEKETVYWRMKDGRLISVDDMDVQHLRNTLKMIIKNKLRVSESKKYTDRFNFNGEIAQEMYDNALIEEMMGDLLDEWHEQN